MSSRTAVTVSVVFALVAHQILPEILHEGRDKESYEYGNADRAAQYYGVLHWETAREALVKKLGE